jgi:antitoxin component of MazEF toxin-antitoxin module
MGYPTRLQAIKRGRKVQWVINFPAALAAAMNFKKSEVVEWEVEDKNILKLKRTKTKRSTPQ